MIENSWKMERLQCNACLTSNLNFMRWRWTCWLPCFAHISLSWITKFLDSMVISIILNFGSSNSNDSEDILVVNPKFYRLTYDEIRVASIGINGPLSWKFDFNEAPCPSFTFSAICPTTNEFGSLAYLSASFILTSFSIVVKPIRYVSVIWFVLHVLQLLSTIFIQQNSCCISKYKIKHMQKLDWKSNLHMVIGSASLLIF